MQVTTYLRVSTDDQAKCGTVETQRHELARFCAAAGHEIAAEYCDEGVSGSIPIDQRPEGSRLLAAVKAGKVDAIAVYRLDRLGRDAWDVLATVALLRARKLQLLSPTENYDDTPAGVLSTGVRALIAQYEREVIRDRTIAGKRRRAREGGWWGGPRPYGYTGVSDPHPRIVPCPKTAETAKQIYEWCGQDRLSLSQIVTRLNARQIPGPRGKHWGPTVIRSILVNPTYKGRLVYGRSGNNTEDPIERDIEAIVSDDLWDAAQQTLATNRSDKSGRPHEPYALTGVARCGRCGSAVVGNAKDPKRRYAYYRCSANCGLKMIRKEKAEQLVIRHLEKLIENPDDTLLRISQAADKHAPDPQRLEKCLADLKASLAAKDAEREEVVILRARRMISDEMFTRQMDRLNREADDVKAELDAVEADRSRASLQAASLKTLAHHLHSYKQRLERGDAEERRHAVRNLVRDIRIQSAEQQGRTVHSLTITFIFADAAPSIGAASITSRCCANRAHSQAAAFSLVETLIAA